MQPHDTPGAAGSEFLNRPVRIQFAIASSSIGLVLVARSAAGVCAVLLGDDPGALRRDLQLRFPATVLADGDTQLGELAAKIASHIDAPERQLEVAVDMVGTEFQRTVWRALREIPVGSIATYTEIATRIGLPGAARAVAHACATNPLAVIVPCHRVVRGDGGLAGYRWGLDRKRALLAREAALKSLALSLEFDVTRTIARSRRSA